MAILRSLATTSLLLLTPALAKPGRPTQYSLSCCNLDLGFDPILAATQAKLFSNHSYEFGVAAEALYELYNGDLTIFGGLSFPFGALPVLTAEKPDFPALQYAMKHIWIMNETLADPAGSSGDPASLGVSAVLLGQNQPIYLNASTRQYEHLTSALPRWTNGAISSQEAYAELRSDFIYMATPFMAFYGAAMGSPEILTQAVEQCMLYRQILQDPATGLWRHIVGPQHADPGHWSTGNGWAAMGMARVLATLLHWPPTSVDDTARILQADLFKWIGEILRGVRQSGSDANGLLRNYLDDPNSFGETTGTALLAATVYRLAVLQNEARELFDFGTRGSDGEVVADPVDPGMLDWADYTFAAVAAQVNKRSVASPAANPSDWASKQPSMVGSAEGQSALLMLYSARRDCQKAGACATVEMKPFDDFWATANSKSA